MTRTKKRLFKTLVTVMLLFIMAFSVTGNAFAESTDVSAATESVKVPTATLDYKKQVVTLISNCNHKAIIKIKVERSQGYSVITVIRVLKANEPQEIKAKEFFPDEAVIMKEIVSVDFTAPYVPTESKASANTYLLIIIFIAQCLLIALLAIYLIPRSDANSKSKEE